MTEISMALLELFRKDGLENDVDLLRKGVRLLKERSVELDMSAKVGVNRREKAGRHQSFKLKLGIIERSYPGQ